MKADKKINSNFKSSNYKTKSRKKSKSNIGSIVKYTLLTLIVLTFIVGGAFAGVIFGWIRTAEPVPSEAMNLTNSQTSIVYDQSGKKISFLTSSDNEDREVVSISKIPMHVQKAFVAIEDERFYKHNGFDPVALIRVAFRKLKDWDNQEGGSTITMQLVKNLTQKKEVELKRKVQEQYLAMELESRFDKAAILETYLNLISMGGNTYGIQAASLKYFGKGVNKLSIAEGACLAAIPKYNTKYAPLTEDGRKYNLERQKLVLAAMLKNNFINNDQYYQATHEKIEFAKRSEYIHRTGTQIRPYFVDHAIQAVKIDLIKAGYTEEGAINLIYGGGIKIHTTMDSKIQNAMNSVYNNKSYFPNGPLEKKMVQSAMVILDTNGQIKAMYGGQGKKTGNLIFNRATQAFRQPGSSIKPIAVYGPAVDQNFISSDSVIDDSPVHLNPQDPRARYPQNASGDYRGLTTIREAIRRSVNVVAAKVYMKIGPNIPLEYLRRAGIDRSQKNVALAMGGMDQGVSPLQMAAAYVPFVHKGIYIEPYSYTKVVDSQGTVIIDKMTNSTVKPKLTVVYKEGTAAIMTDMLEDVVGYGTAGSYGIIQSGRIASAGKTGTTTDTKDKWFLGYTPYYVGATWYGYDKATGMPEQSQALRIWNAVMNSIHKELPSKTFDKSSNTVKVKVCTYSGLRPNAYCSLDVRSGSRAPVTTSTFVKGSEPSKTDICDIHVSALVCKYKLDGKWVLAGSNCPAIDKVFINRKSKFTKQYKSDPYPADWKYELPHTVCQRHTFIPVDPLPTPGPTLYPSYLPTFPPTESPIPED